MPAVTCYSRLDCERKFSSIKIDEFVKTSKFLAIVIPALDNNTQGQAAAGIK
jgi:hypothetical protein